MSGRAGAWTCQRGLSTKFNFVTGPQGHVRWWCASYLPSAAAIAVSRPSGTITARYRLTRKKTSSSACISLARNVTVGDGWYASWWRLQTYNPGGVNRTQRGPTAEKLSGRARFRSRPVDCCETDRQSADGQTGLPGWQWSVGQVGAIQSAQFLVVDRYTAANAGDDRLGFRGANCAKLANSQNLCDAVEIRLTL